MKKALKIVGVLVLVLLLAAGGLVAWASTSSARTLDRTIETHRVDFPIPFPLDSAAAAGLDEEEVEALAFDQAVERGSHLVSARYVCTACHGDNLAGGTMIDVPVMFSMFGPNLTGGPGSRVAEFTAADWDRIVRHGVFPDGKPAAMPSGDFQLMTDQELSDIIAYIRSLPPVSNQVPPRALGPMGKVLMATGQITLSADEIGVHDAPHMALPPVADTTLEFGKHLAGVCSGCHTPSLAGGPIAGGDPSWPPAGNLTPTGLGSWSYEQFVTALRESRRPDGSELLAPMNEVAPFAQRMTDVELRALWLYLQSLPPTPTPGRVTRLERALAELDRINGEDPRTELVDGRAEPKELVYARRMSETLAALAPDASEVLRVAVRAQHVARWRIPRSSYPDGRDGYKRWRTELMAMHGRLAGDVLRDAGYDENAVARVGRLLRKEGIKRDPEVQALEDVACLVFLRWYLAEFAAEHDDDKLVDIMRKTWRKMSARGHEAAGALDLGERGTRLLTRALSEG